MGLGGNDGGAHWEVEAQLSGPGDDLDGANRRRGHRRPKVEEELEVDAAGLPAGRGSVRGVEDDVAELVGTTEGRGGGCGRGGSRRRRRPRSVEVRGS